MRGQGVQGCIGDHLKAPNGKTGIHQDGDAAENIAGLQRMPQAFFTPAFEEKLEPAGPNDVDLIECRACLFRQHRAAGKGHQGRLGGNGFHRFAGKTRKRLDLRQDADSLCAHD